MAKYTFSAPAIARKLKPLVFGARQNPRQGKIDAATDSEGLREYIIKKRELEEKEFPKIKISFP